MINRCNGGKLMGILDCLTLNEKKKKKGRVRGGEGFCKVVANRAGARRFKVRLHLEMYS